jgi:quinol-cytochrome oxidoreductase complex cytochrome b subunit
MKYFDKLYTTIIVLLSFTSFAAAGVLIVSSVINQEQEFIFEAFGLIAIGISTAMFFLYLNKLKAGESKKDVKSN